MRPTRGKWIFCWISQLSFYEGMRAMNLDAFYNCIPNNEACISTECSTMSAMKRSGFVCDEFPFYSGGWHLFDYDTYWDDYVHTRSQCVMSSSLSSQCTKWTIHSNMTWPFDQICSCNTHSNGHCQIWKCFASDFMEYDTNSMDPQPISSCQCTASIPNPTNSTMSVCIEWECTELFGDTPNANRMHQQVDQSAIFNASYKCVSVKSDDDVVPFCSEWTADKISSDSSSWKVSQCQCHGQSRCDMWWCTERSMAYYQIPWKQFHLGWISITVTGGLLMLCASARMIQLKQYQYRQPRSISSLICAYIIAVGLAGIGLACLEMLCYVVSGFAGVIFVAGAWIICAFAIFPCIQWLCNKQNDSFWGEEVEENSSLEPDLGYHQTTVPLGRTNSSLANLLRAAVGKSTENCEENQEESHFRCHYDPYEHSACESAVI